MCPAIHINSRSWLRSSSTHEPSDPPPRVVFFFTSLWLSRVAGNRNDGQALIGQCCGQQDRRFAFELYFECEKKYATQMESEKRNNTIRGAIGWPARFKYPRKCVASSTPRRIFFCIRFSNTQTVRVESRPDKVVCAAQVGESRPLSVLGLETDRAMWFFPFLRRRKCFAVMILPQVHLRKPCYDFYFL